ncbi:sigma-70 family RNA polymerase sigma factor [Tunturiibacter gelidoferens]|uniref:DNA-directed RNA polymerase specialized sigma24 family protein n=1 Tax=Tunturiibacter gelidiferens TaxID=3069689 RepID=A0A9X0QJU7_9BACT|nr:sigma-70 family RNA polymerase sigma factor [Edaphobacter lichenicola]MBB5331797.1 DNA-directed RNA polymerase specialized sigma24 family protein [Edaphobacter lichenicola]
MATAVITTPPIDLAVAALRMNWLLPNPAETSATPHSLILPFLWASEHVEYEHPDESKKYKMVGPASYSPGPWLSVGIVDCLLSDERGELTNAEEGRYQRLRAVQYSFRGYLHDNNQRPAPFLGNNLNTFGNVFTDEELAIHLSEEELEEATDTDVEQCSFEVAGPVAGTEDDELNEEDDFAARVDVSSSDPKFEISVVHDTDAEADKELDKAYFLWLEDPSTQPSFIRALYDFVHERMGRTTVATKLWLADEVDDSASEFVVTMMETLQKMRDGFGKHKEVRRLDKPCHYVYRALAETRKGEVVKLTKHQETCLCVEYLNSDGEEESRFDDASETARNGYFHDDEPDFEFRKDVFEERSSQWGELIEALPVELQPVARMYYLQALTQKQIETDSGITQGAVSKQLTRVREIMSAYVAKKSQGGYL